MKRRRPPPGLGISRRKEERIFIRFDKVYEKLKLLKRGGASKVAILEEALDQLAEAEGILPEG